MSGPTRHRVVAWALMLVVVTGCAAGTERSDPTIAVDGSPDLDRQAIVASTVRVRADGCGPRTELGTGTVIADGLVVTAAHVVAGADRVDLVDATGETKPAEVVWFDPDLDIAALRSSADVGPGATLRDETARAGERGVIAVVAGDGSVAVMDVEVVQRVTIRTTDIHGDDPVERPGLRIDADVAPGDSGAMVHLPGGGVGIVWSRSTTADDQAWTVDLPSELRGAAAGRELVERVDVGRCR